MFISSLSRFFVPTEASKLAELLNIQAGFSVAEVGAGKGLISFYFSKIVGPSGFVFTTEFNPDKLAKINILYRFC